MSDCEKCSIVFAWRRSLYRQRDILERRIRRREKDMADAKERAKGCNCELCSMRKCMEELEAELVRVRKQRDEARREVEVLKAGRRE